MQHFTGAAPSLTTSASNEVVQDPRLCDCCAPIDVEVIFQGYIRIQDLFGAFMSGSSTRYRVLSWGETTSVLVDERDNIFEALYPTPIGDPEYSVVIPVSEFDDFILGDLGVYGFISDPAYLGGAFKINYSRPIYRFLWDGSPEGEAAFEAAKAARLADAADQLASYQAGTATAEAALEALQDALTSLESDLSDLGEEYATLKTSVEENKQLAASKSSEIIKRQNLIAHGGLTDEEKATLQAEIVTLTTERNAALAAYNTDVDELNTLRNATLPQARYAINEQKYLIASAESGLLWRAAIEAGYVNLVAAATANTGALYLTGYGLSTTSPSGIGGTWDGAGVGGANTVRSKLNTQFAFLLVPQNYVGGYDLSEGGTFTVQYQLRTVDAGVVSYEAGETTITLPAGGTHARSAWITIPAESHGGPVAQSGSKYIYVVGPPSRGNLTIEELERWGAQGVKQGFHPYTNAGTIIPVYRREDISGDRPACAADGIAAKDYTGFREYDESGEYSQELSEDLAELVAARGPWPANFALAQKISAPVTGYREPTPDAGNATQRSWSRALQCGETSQEETIETVLSEELTTEDFQQILDDLIDNEVNPEDYENWPFWADVPHAIDGAPYGQNADPSFGYPGDPFAIHYLSPDETRYARQWFRLKFRYDIPRLAGAGQVDTCSYDKHVLDLATGEITTTTVPFNLTFSGSGSTTFSDDWIVIVADPGTAVWVDNFQGHLREDYHGALVVVPTPV